MTRKTVRRGLGIIGLALVLWVAFMGFNAMSLVILLVCIGVLVGVDRSVGPYLERLAEMETEPEEDRIAEEKVSDLLAGLPDCTVLSGIPGRYGKLEHVVFRKDGAVFFIETKSHKKLITEDVAERFLKRNQRKVLWLRDYLASRLGFQPWINTAIVFTYAPVEVDRPIDGVHFLESPELVEWMAKTPGNPATAVRIWVSVERLAKDLKR